MNKEEMIKEAYTLMVKNNPDEAIKNLIRLDKELDKKNKIVFKAINYIKDLDKNEFETIDDVIVLDNYLSDLLDILRGDSDENN